MKKTTQQQQNERIKKLYRNGLRKQKNEWKTKTKLNKEIAVKLRLQKEVRQTEEKMCNKQLTNYVNKCTNLLYIKY